MSKYLIYSFNTVCCVLFLSQLAIGQYVQSYNTSSGFLSNTVYHIEKDKNGYLWFCTDKGVVKYNGQSFQNYNTENGLTDNEVFKCFEDSYGRMWFFTFNGYHCYYQNDTFYNASNSLMLKQLKTFSYISSMFEDAISKDLYIGYINGPIIRISNNQTSTLQSNLKDYETIKNIYSTNNGIQVLSNVASYNIVKDSLVHLKNAKQHVFYFLGKRIVSDKNGIRMYDDDDDIVWQTEDHDASFSNIYKIYFDGANIYCGTKSGLLVYNIKTGKKHKYFTNSRVTSIESDIHGNIWVSTLNKGVTKLYIANVRDVTCLPDLDQYEQIITKAGQVFFRSKNHVKYLSISDSGVALPDISIPGNKIYELAYINDSLLFYFSPTGTKYKTESYIYNYKRKIRRELDSVLFSRVYNINKETFLVFHSAYIAILKYVNDEIEIINKKNIYPAIQSEKFNKETGSLYFFSDNTFFHYDANTHQVQSIDTLYNVGGTKEILFRSNKILLLLNNRTLITYDAGTLKKIGVLDLEEPVFDMEKIRDGVYLVNTNHGYCVLDMNKSDSRTIPLEKIFYPFEQKDILSLNCLPNDYILCNAKDGLYYFHQGLINKKRYKPSLLLTHITLNEQAQPVNTDTLFANNKTNINIQVSPIYFGNDELSYRYRICEGEDTGKWNRTKSSSINFSINSPGFYKIEFQATSSYGYLSDTKIIHINITPTFFSSILFYVILVIGTLIILLLLFMLYVRSKKRVHKRELAYMQLQHKAVNSLLNPHFIFNAINNIQNLVNQNSKEAANEYLATLSVMIRQNIENLQYELIPLEKELDLITNYIELQNLRFNNRIDYVIKNNSESSVRVPPLLVHTFVENSIVHGFDKSIDNFCVKVDVSDAKDDYVDITITDNGVGLNIASERKYVQKDNTSLGIAFNKDRLERLSKFYNVKYSFSIEDLSTINDSSGTRVHIMIYGKF